MPIKSIIGACIMFVLAMNFFIRTIRFFYQSSNIAFSKDTLHTFLCEECNETYQLNGQVTKKKIKFSLKKEINSPQKSRMLYKFTCPKCNKNAYQEKIFDLNTNKGLGIVRIKADHNQTTLFKEYIVKCLLPTLIGFWILTILF